MRNPKLVSYETIVKATSGEPEAIDEVLRHYSKPARAAMAFSTAFSSVSLNISMTIFATNLTSC